MEYNDKQKDILKVAEVVISEKGFEAASIREISKRAKINLAMVSYYFGSKEKLMEALFIARASDLRIKSEIIVQDASLGNLQKILKLTENYMEKVFSNLNFHKIMLKELSYIHSHIVLDQIKKMKTANYGLIDTVLQDGIKAGIFNAKINTDMVISLVNGTLSNYALNESYYRYRWNLNIEQSFEEQTKDKIKEQIFYSLKAILLYHD